MIKQLQDEKEEMKVRYEAKLDTAKEDLRRQEDLFKTTLSEIKLEYQERIVFLQTLLAPSPSTTI